ncbi:hypothetical protein IT417_00080 [bacterium]|nr:hypothetical protein [bacterium]
MTLLPSLYNHLQDLEEQIGFTTGVLFKFPQFTLKEKVNLFYECGSTAIEVMYHNTEVGDRSFENEVRELDLNKFQYRSLHLPKFPFDINERTREVISNIKEFDRHNNFHAFIIHPDEVRNWDSLSDIKDKLLVENMDRRKLDGRSVEEVKKYLEIGDFNMVLDINHTYSHDPSMNLFKKFIENFKPKIKQLHISGFDSYFDHELMYKVKQDVMNEPLKQFKGIPKIIESVVWDNIDSKVALKKELAYFKAFL